MTAASSGSDIVFARGELAAQEGLAPGFPILLWPDGSINEPCFMHFSWLLDERRLAVSSMRPAAYVLREWFDFCRAEDLAWDAPRDAFLMRWRTVLMDGRKGDGRWVHRVETRLSVVFEFYRCLDRSFPYLDDGRRRRPVVALEGVAPVDAGDALTIKQSGKRVVWSGAGKAADHWLPSPVPDNHVVAQVLTYLRSGSSTAGRERPAAQWLADRNWIIGRVMSQAGFRSGEVSGLTLDAIHDMLVGAGLLVWMPPRLRAAMHPLHDLATDKVGRERLLDALEALSRTRPTLSLHVVGKGDKKRVVQVPVGLVRDILEVAIWSTRRRQLQEQDSAASSAGAPAWLFLSEKTGSRLTAPSVGQLVGRAFKARGLLGSAHKLRAHYAMEQAFRIFGAKLEATGGREVPGMVETAYVELAGLMGHSKVTTTVRHYVEMARLYHARAGTGCLSSGCGKAISAELAKFRGTLSRRKLELLVSLVRSVLESEDQHNFIGLLEMALEDHNTSRHC